MSEFIMVRIKVDHTKTGRDHYKDLKETVRKAINKVPGVVFQNISLMQNPDPYLLDDPDNPPPDFK